MMRIERLPGYESCVGRSDEAEHRAMLADPRYRTIAAIGADGTICAFAILRDLDDAHGNLYLKRVAVDGAGRGVGSAFLAEIVASAFARLQTHRFWLDCFADNYRAQRVYEKLGFSRDGILREAYRMADGTRRDLVLMALTRPQWVARTLGVAGPQADMRAPRAALVGRA